jgi:hypothetical protein
VRRRAITLSIACATVCATVCALDTRSLAAQQPTPPRPQRDTLPAARSDSALRDSVVTQALAQDSARTAGTTPGAFSMLGLDRLRLRTAGLTMGWAWPGQALGTHVYSLQADYGEVYPGFRVIFVSSYWATRYRDAEVERLAQEVQRAADGGTVRGDTVRLGRIRVSDLSAGADLRWQPGLARRARQLLRVVQPWVAGGAAAHFVNVDGAPVSGTFIERALDAASIGLGAGVGLDVYPLPNVQVTAQARYDFVGSVRYGSVRMGASFVFDARDGRAGGGAR